MQEWLTHHAEVSQVFRGLLHNNLGLLDGLDLALGEAAYVVESTGTYGGLAAAGSYCIRVFYKFYS